MEDSDYDSDDENWNFVPEAIATSGFNSEQRHLLEKYLIAQNYEKMDEEVIFDVAGLLFSLNDTGFMSKLAFNQNFQSQLLQKCFSYGKAGLFTQTTFMQRVQKAMDVPDDEFSKFKAAISLFCDIARIGLISLSDEDFTNGKFVVPGTVHTTSPQPE